MVQKQLHYKAICLLLFALLCTATLRANPLGQTDTSKVLPVVKVMGLRYPSFFAGSKFQLLDSNILFQYQQQNLSQLLAGQSQVFIKSYGPSALSTASFRGGNANHTPVLWNGFALQSPLNGQTDLALIPAFLLEGIAIQYGSPAVLFGSGAIGGSIHLQTQNKSLQGNHIKVMTGVGSFGIYSFGLKTQIEKKGWKFNQGFYRQQGKNDFSYHAANLLQPGNLTISPELSRARHANFITHSYLQEVEGSIGKNHQLAMRLWWQEANRELPDFVGLSEVQGQQKDGQLRLMAEYKYKRNRYELNSRTGWFEDKIRYQDLFTGISNSSGKQLTQFIDQYWRGQNFEWLVGQMFQRMQGQAEVFQNNMPQSFLNTQQRVAIFGSIKHQAFQKKLQQQLSLRNEWVDGQRAPLMPSYGLQWFVHKSTSILMNASRTFRLPTFNDLYWPQMGNKSLKPEIGYTYELSIKNRFALSQTLTYQHTLSVYHKRINQWILWVPISANLSKPMNLHEVISKGFEWQWQLQKSMGKLNLFVAGLSDMNSCQPIRSELMGDSSLFKQLIFAPRIKHQLQLGANIKGLQCLYTWNYVGNRFTSSDNQNWLAPYKLHHVAVSYGLNLKNHAVSFQIGIQNLFNETYQVMVNRPMPLRNYQLSINYQL
jgi:vitamin B12 transporter